jgi:hypothetical protein
MAASLLAKALLAAKKVKKVKEKFSKRGLVKQATGVDPSRESLFKDVTGIEPSASNLLREALKKKKKKLKPETAGSPRQTGF